MANTHQSYSAFDTAGCFIKSSGLDGVFYCLTLNPNCIFCRVGLHDRFCLHPDRQTFTSDQEIKSDSSPPRHAEVITFRVACCSKLGINKKEFGERVLMECLPWYHGLLGRIWWRLDQLHFRPDLVLLRSVANCTKVNEIIQEINYYHEKEAFNLGFLRKTIRLRLSGRRLVKLANRVFSEPLNRTK